MPSDQQLREEIILQATNIGNHFIDQAEEIAFLDAGSDWHDETVLGTITRVDGSTETVFIFFDSGHITYQPPITLAAKDSLTFSTRSAFSSDFTDVAGRWGVDLSWGSQFAKTEETS